MEQTQNGSLQTPRWNGGFSQFDNVRNVNFDFLNQYFEKTTRITGLSLF